MAMSAFAEMSQQGTLRGVASVLHLDEQGVRNRLVAQEQLLTVLL
jgi:hypothetical protein